MKDSNDEKMNYHIRYALENTAVGKENIKKYDYDVKNQKLYFDMKIKNRNNWLFIGVISVLAILVIFVTIYSVITGQRYNIDTAIVLTTLLAFFSIFLSATFYFKTTEQSNAFYDRSYSHTKDIAQSLSEMSGKFGKSLEVLEQHSDTMTRKVDDLPNRLLEKEKDVENVEEEREKLLEELYEKAGLKDKEKEEFENKLKRQDEEISRYQYEINLLKSRLNERKVPPLNRDLEAKSYLELLVGQLIGSPSINDEAKSREALSKYIIRNSTASTYKRLARYGFIEGELLTEEAYNYLRKHLI